MDFACHVWSRCCTSRIPDLVYTAFHSGNWRVINLTLSLFILWRNQYHLLWDKIKRCSFGHFLRRCRSQSVASLPDKQKCTRAARTVRALSIVYLHICAVSLWRSLIVVICIVDFVWHEITRQSCTISRLLFVIDAAEAQRLWVPLDYVFGTQLKNLLCKVP